MGAPSLDFETIFETWIARTSTHEITRSETWQTLLHHLREVHASDQRFPECDQSHRKQDWSYLESQRTRSDRLGLHPRLLVEVRPEVTRKGSLTCQSRLHLISFLICDAHHTSL